LVRRVDKSITNATFATMRPVDPHATACSLPGPRQASCYRRQYAGILVNGKRQLYVNGFDAPCEYDLPGEPNQWRARALDVCDGGPSSWGLVYDIEASSFLASYYDGILGMGYECRVAP
jgi:hypothetical protein